jgi:hypothetical protein
VLIARAAGPGQAGDRICGPCAGVDLDCTCAAGGLALLFALPLTRIVQLHRGDLSARAGRRFLTIGSHQTLLPPPLADLLDRLTTEPDPEPAGQAQPLFPGRPASQPISASALGEQLNRHGIHVRTARNTALISLASELPAAVVAELVGINISTAVRWSTYARQDWAAYLEAREPPPERRGPSAAVFGGPAVGRPGRLRPHQPLHMCRNRAGLHPVRLPHRPATGALRDA